MTQNAAEGIDSMNFASSVVQRAERLCGVDTGLGIFFDGMALVQAVNSVCSCYDANNYHYHLLLHCTRLHPRIRGISGAREKGGECPGQVEI